MTFDIEKQALGKVPIQIVELTLPRCSRRCGVAPCTGSTSGPSKCYNTLATCQDVPNFVSEPWLLHVASARIDELQGVNGCPCFPTLLDANTAPTEITPTEGLGVRASLSVSIQDHPFHDIGLDYYAQERGYDPETRGTLWGKLIARWKYLENLPIRLLTGFLSEAGDYSPANFRAKGYFLQKVAGPSAGGQVSLTCKDPLRWGDKEKAQCPLPSGCVLSADLNATDSIFTVDNIGDIPAACEWLRIDKEVMAILSRDTGAGTFTVQRATLPVWYDAGTMTAEDHQEGATVQGCVLFDGVRMDAIIQTLLADYTQVPAGYLDPVQWAAEADVWFNTYYFSTLLTEPMEVTALLEELCQHLAIIWWNERTSKITLTAIKPASGALPRLDDDSSLIADSVSIGKDTEARMSQVWIYYAMRSPVVENEEKLFNYRFVKVSADLDAELPDEYGQPAIRQIRSRWLGPLQDSIAVEIASRLLAEYRDTKVLLDVAVDAKDDGIWTAGFCRCLTRYRQGVSGDPVSTPYLVLSSDESYNGGQAGVKYRLRECAQGARCASFAPDGTFDYVAANEETRELYGFFCDSVTLKMPNGDPPYTFC
jgi:hypothetical protein